MPDGNTHPQSDPYDIAVVVFPSRIAGITPARLPTAGLSARQFLGQFVTLP